MSLRTVSAAEMKDLDRMAMKSYGIPSLILMENAGRGVAEMMRLKEGDKSKRVLVACGKGNNGGDGFVAARHLWNAGYAVQLLLFSKAEELKGDPAINFQIVQKMGVPLATIHQFKRKQNLSQFIAQTNIVVDAIFGVGLDRELGEPYRPFIELLNDSGRSVLSVDLPSGIHSDTGVVMGVAVRAKWTATLGLPKKGLFEGRGPEYAGQVQVIDMSLPRNLLGV